MKKLSLSTVAAVLIACTLVGATGLLISEYAYFKEKARKLSLIKKEYKQFLRKYRLMIEVARNQELAGRTDASDDDAEDSEDEESDADDDIADENEIDDEVEPCVSMVVLNRDEDYLRKAALAHAKAHSIESRMKQMLAEGQSDLPSLETLVNKKKKKTVVAPSGQRRPQAKRLYAPPSTATDAPQFMCPIDKQQFWISSRYGWRKRKGSTWRFHYGVDMAAVKGTPVYAAAEGTVADVSRLSTGYGNCIVLAHNQKYKTRYAHLSQIFVKPGQHVNKGDKIGAVGSTGLVVGRYGRDSASHLHFEVLAFKKQINPLWVVQK